MDEDKTGYEVDENGVNFTDDAMLEMLNNEPETACSVVWASCKQLVLETEMLNSDLSTLDDDLKNAYIVAKAMDMVVQSMQLLAQEYEGIENGKVH
jgi:hypothetical protein